MSKIFIKISIWIPVIIMAGIIFGFSKQDGKTSSGLSDKVADVILTGFDKSGFIDYVDNTPENKEKMISYIRYPIRKGAHMSEYALFAILTFLALYVDGIRKKIYFITFGMVTVFAASDEIHQLFVPDRAGMFSDVIIDSIGCIIGLLFIFIITKLKSCHEKKNVV